MFQTKKIKFHCAKSVTDKHGFIPNGFLPN